MKGKHGAIAERRREAQAVETELVALRRKNVELLAEAASLRDRLVSIEKQYRDDTRALRAQRDEGVAPLVAAAESQLRKERAAHQRTKAEMKKLQTIWDNAIHRMTAHFRHDHNMTGLEALEAMSEVVGGVQPGGVTIADGSEGRAGERDRVRAVQRARGYRR